MKVASSHFLISICDREHVAQVRGKSIYKITNVALIPLSSQADADKAIAATREHLQRHNKAHLAEGDDTNSSSEDDVPSVTDSLVEEAAVDTTEVSDPVTGQRGPAQRRTSVAEDVMQRKGVYGRFADKWFSRKGWSAESRRTQGLTSDENLAAKSVPQDVESTMPKSEEQPASSSKPDTIPTEDQIAPSVNPEEIPKALDGEKDAATIALLPKVLQTTRMYFSSGNFFFSYEHDLSHGVGKQHANPSLPLFKQYDPLVSTSFVERHMMADSDSSSGTNILCHLLLKLASILSFFLSSKGLWVKDHSRLRPQTLSRAVWSLIRQRLQMTYN